MPKIAKELTVLEIKRLGQGTFAIGGRQGALHPQNPHSDAFILRYSDATGRHDFSLGSFPETSVAAARKAAREARALIDKGGSPIEEREGQRKAKREAKEAALREVEKSKLTSKPKFKSQTVLLLSGTLFFCSASGRQLTNAVAGRLPENIRTTARKYGKSCWGPKNRLCRQFP